VINPDLVKITKLPVIKAPTTGTGAPDVGAPGGTTAPTTGTGACNSTTSGACSVSNMQSSCFASVAEQASAICIKESGGNETITNSAAKCSGQPVVVGLFQINISANSVGGLSCPSAFDHMYSTSKPNCNITNQALYDQCVAAAKNTATNISSACAIYNGSRRWNSWEANTTTCHF
jgi:hypothetical protein